MTAFIFSKKMQQKKLMSLNERMKKRRECKTWKNQEKP